jgi:predicted ATPase
VVCDASVDLVERPIERSLVRRSASGRLSMMQTIREFALERLESSGDRDGIARADLDYFLGLAEDAALGGDDHTATGLDRLEAERDNFRAAMRWALGEHESELGLRLAGALGRFWAPQDGHNWLTEALASAPDAPPEVRAIGLMWAGSTIYIGDYERSGGVPRGGAASPPSSGRYEKRRQRARSPR